MIINITKSQKDDIYHKSEGKNFFAAMEFNLYDNFALPNFFIAMHDIKSREDISLLVRAFYGKVQKDKLLGPIFNGIIEDWEHHYEHLTDFWQTNLFFEKKFTGNPLQKHVEVDKRMHGTINEMHFGVWINLWFETIDELFEGDVAQIAKNRARNMGTFIHLKMFEARGKSGQ